MILATRHAGNREMRFNDAYYHSSLQRGFGAMTSSGVTVTDTDALGIAALGRAIRLIGGTFATLRIGVYEGRRGDRRERPDSIQALVLDRPVVGGSDYDWRWDVATALEATENAFLLKVKDKTGRVVELVPLPCSLVDGKVEHGRKVFTVRNDRGQIVAELGTDDVLHIRGQTVGGGAFGVSRISQHRDPIGAVVAASRFEGATYANDVRPGLVFAFPQGVTVTQAEQWQEKLIDGYGGLNRGKPMVVGGGVEIKDLPVSLADAQFVETRQYSVDEIGRIMDIEPVMLGVSSKESDDKAAVSRFLSFQLRTRLARIERGLKADPDLFPPGVSLYPLCDIDDLMYADPLTRAQVQHYRVQNGTELVDEARADNGRGSLPPIPDDPSLEPGKVPQITPVGGAPALPIGGSKAPSDEDRSTGTHETRERMTADLRIPTIEVLVPDTSEELRATVREAFDRMEDMTSAIRELPSPPVPVIHVAAPEVTVNVPETIVHVAAPDVHVAAPEVTVNSPPAEVTINMPERPEAELTVERNPNGTIKSARLRDV